MSNTTINILYLNFSYDLNCVEVRKTCRPIYYRNKNFLKAVTSFTDRVWYSTIMRGNGIVCRIAILHLSKRKQMLNNNNQLRFELSRFNKTNFNLAFIEESPIGY